MVNIETSLETQKQKVVPQLEVRVLKNLVDMEKTCPGYKGHSLSESALASVYIRQKDTVGVYIRGEASMKMFGGS